MLSLGCSVSDDKGGQSPTLAKGQHDCEFYSATLSMAILTKEQSVKSHTWQFSISLCFQRIQRRTKMLSVTRAMGFCQHNEIKFYHFISNAAVALSPDMIRGIISLQKSLIVTSYPTRRRRSTCWYLEIKSYAHTSIQNDRPQHRVYKTCQTRNLNDGDLTKYRIHSCLACCATIVTMPGTLS